MSDLLHNHWPLLLVLGTLAVLGINQLITRRPPPPYVKRRSLVTNAERQFLQTLREAVDEEYEVCTMVRLADLIRVRSGTSKYQAWQNRIQSKHIDFVLCDHESMEALLCVELDDSTHRRPDRAARDKFVNSALRAASLPLLRVPVDSEYCPDELREAIDEKMAG